MQIDIDFRLPDPAVFRVGGGVTAPDLIAAKETALAGFTDGLIRDLAAIRAALSLPWSTGPVEGQISYLKTIKRTMSGRAKFDLLRHRILEAA